MSARIRSALSELVVDRAPETAGHIAARANEISGERDFRGMAGTITGPAPLTMVRVKDSIRLRLEKMVDRYEEIGRSLADPAVIGRQREFRDLSVEYARLTPIAEKFGAFRSLERELASAQEMQNDGDPAMRDMGAEEAARLAPLIEQAESELKMMLIP